MTATVNSMTLEESVTGHLLRSEASVHPEQDEDQLPCYITIAPELDTIIQAEGTGDACTRPHYSFVIHGQNVGQWGSHSRPVMKIAKTPVFLPGGSCSFQTTGIGRQRM